MAFKIDEKKKNAATIASILAIVAALISIYFTNCRETQYHPDYSAYIGLAEHMVTEVAKAVEGTGEIVLITMDGPDASPVLAVENKAFSDALQKQKNLKLAGTAKLRYGPPPTDAMPPNPFSTEVFLQLLEKYPNAKALVSFVGPPDLQEADFQKIPEQHPKILVCPNTTPQLKRMIEEQIITLAFVMRFEAYTGPEPKGKEDFFQRAFQKLTSENVESFPDELLTQ